MTHLSQRFGIALLVLVCGLAATAHAGTRLYNGSIHIQAFGNDTTTGGTIKLLRDDFSAFPWDGNCAVGPFHSQETVTFPTQANEGGSVMFT